MAGRAGAGPPFFLHCSLNPLTRRLLRRDEGMAAPGATGRDASGR